MQYARNGHIKWKLERFFENFGASDMAINMSKNSLDNLNNTEVEEK